MTTESLAAMELAEANNLLSEFRGDRSLSGVLFVFGLLCLVAAAALLFIGRPDTGKAVAAASITFVMWAIAAYKRTRSRTRFAEMRSKFMKLQQAGYQLYIVGRIHPTIEIASGNSATAGKPIDFNGITHRSRILDEGAA